VIAGILKTVVSYKMHHTSERHFWIRLLLWMVVLTGLVFAQPIYIFLFSNNLTETEPLSLFDVIQITGIVFTFFIANRAASKIDLLENRVQELHQKLSIRLSEKAPNSSPDNMDI
jgi:hypothetical protein